MKAIYEVKFLNKKTPATVSDTRRKAGDASTGKKKLATKKKLLRRLTARPSSSR